MLLRASRGMWSAFLCFSVLMLFLVLVVGCGGSGGGGQDQQQEQASDETTLESTSQGQQQAEELAPVSRVTADRQYAGRVEGTDAFIGIAVREQPNELIAYVCDIQPPGGEVPSEAIEAWFQGTIEGDVASLTADGGEESLQVRLAPEAITGTFTNVNGNAYDFVAEQVDVDRNAGLYWTPPAEGEGLDSRGGTIVLPSGEERGVKVARYM